jgi:hypothetical protein
MVLSSNSQMAGHMLYCSHSRHQMNKLSFPLNASTWYLQQSGVELDRD